MPDNKVSGRDLAAVYAAPELLQAPQSSQGAASGPQAAPARLPLSPATDVFAFAKVRAKTQFTPPASWRILDFRTELRVVSCMTAPDVEWTECGHLPQVVWQLGGEACRRVWCVRTAVLCVHLYRRSCGSCTGGACWTRGALLQQYSWMRYTRMHAKWQGYVAKWSCMHGGCASAVQDDACRKQYFGQGCF